MDVVETADKICFHFDLPGIADKTDINLTIDNNVLRLDCKKPEVRKDIR
jgi:HSP20 family molecular chaperone IbpA